MINNFSIEQFIDHNYITDIRENRRRGNNGTQEFFTPFSIVQRMGNKIDDETWADPTKTSNLILFIFIYNRTYEE